MNRLIHFPGFVAQGTAITNPTCSDCGRFVVSPETYGFRIEQTGGGFTAWRRDLTPADELDGSYILLTGADEDEPSHELGEPRAPFFLGLYDDEGGVIGIWKLIVGVVQSEDDDEGAPVNLWKE